MNLKRNSLKIKAVSLANGIACLNTNRNFIGIEKDDEYFLMAKERILNRYKEIKK